MIETVIKNPSCPCPVCKDKIFEYPHNLPHNRAPLDYKFFSINVEDRKRLKYIFFEFLKDAEEITNLIHNIYRKEGIEAVEMFCEKTGINKMVEMIEKTKKERWIKISRLLSKGAPILSLIEEKEKIRHLFSYGLDIELTNEMLENGNDSNC